MRQLIKYDLDFENAHRYFKTYFLNHISDSEQVLKQFNLDNGHFYTLLPKIAYIDRLYDFDLSGILPAENLLEEKQTLPNGEIYIPRCVFSTVAELKSVLFEYVEQDKSNQVMMLSKNETEYLNFKIPSKSIKKLISNFIEREFYLICLFKNLDIRKRDRILAGTHMFFFPAYDEEAFLVWKHHDFVTRGNL
jgi:hypothetical protein